MRRASSVATQIGCDDHRLQRRHLHLRDDGHAGSGDCDDQSAQQGRADIIGMAFHLRGEGQEIIARERPIDQFVPGDEAAYDGRRTGPQAAHHGDAVDRAQREGRRSDSRAGKDAVHAVNNHVAIVAGNSKAPSPSISTMSAESGDASSGITSISLYSDNAMPRQSKPGPRLAVVAGTKMRKVEWEVLKDGGMMMSDE
jgi:hypothetical protein